MSQNKRHVTTLWELVHAFQDRYARCGVSASLVDAAVVVGVTNALPDGRRRLLLRMSRGRDHVLGVIPIAARA